MCVLLSTDNRTGNWDKHFPSNRFTVSEEFVYTSDRATGGMRSYCKTLPEPPTQAPSAPPTVSRPDGSYDFPPVATSQFVHGLCAMGASYFTATATDQNLTYKVGSNNFQDGVRLWSNRDYVVDGIQGADMCEGGIYLEPSRHKVSVLWLRLKHML